MKNKRRNIISYILLIIILSIIFHGIIPHHHHDDLEHSGHTYFEQSAHHSNSEIADPKHCCQSHSSDNVELCEACHFSIDVVKDDNVEHLIGLATDQNEISLTQSNTTASNISIEVVYKESDFQYYLFRRGPPSII